MMREYPDRMTRATLAVLLSRLRRFPEPKTGLEQYPTPSEAAATALWDAHTRGLLEGKRVLDLGAGTGILGIGAMLLGARVTFVEADEELKEVIEENIALMREHTDQELREYEIIIGDATEEALPRADLVVSNPPFGTKTKHADKRFLEAAMKASEETYSFHKSSTKEHLDEWIRSRGWIVVQRFPFTFSLPPTMRQHQKRSHEVAITCIHARKDL